MEPYRVLLADDEEEIRAGISRKIDWSSLGFALVGEAENGQEALELAEQLRPDVVLTDIKMPFMDGLELCRRLKQSLPAAKLVVFSGFDDFEYARQAIGMDVSEYILKPINAPELMDVLNKLKDQLDRQRLERRDMETLRRRYEESLPVLREMFYARLLDGQIRADLIQERAGRYEIELPQGTWAAALVQVDCLNEAGKPERDELLLLSVRAFLEEHFALEGCTIRAILYNDTVALLAHMGDQGIYPLIEELGRLCALAYSYLGMSLTVGVGLPCDGPEELHSSAEGARSALDYRVLKGSVQVIYIGDMEPDHTVRLAFEEEDQRQLTAAIKLGSQEEVERAKDFIARNYGDGDLSVETLCSYLHLSPTYFSTLFKREVGMSFIAYLTEVRMERAAQLLQETEEKTYLIAEQTGYTDPNYFSYVFKRRFGVSPSKFRAGQTG